MERVVSYDAAVIQNSGNMRLFTAEFPAVYGTCTLSFPFKASLFCENHGLHYCCYIVYPDGAWAVAIA